MTSWLEQTGKDLQYGSRSLLKNPGLSALAILSLATGVMATTVIYSVLHAVVLDPFPYKDVDQLDERARHGRHAARLAHLLFGRSVPRDCRADVDLRRRDRVDD